MAEKTVAPRDKAQTPAREETRSEQRYISPAVDIYENQDGLVVMADLPAVPKNNLDVRVENNILTIQGKPDQVAPGHQVYREYELVNFFRQFELSDRVDQANIRAELKQGVLMLELPKAEQAKPKRIEVNVN